MTTVASFLEGFSLTAAQRTRAEWIVKRFLEADELTPVPERSTLNRTGYPLQLAVRVHEHTSRWRLVVDPFVYRPGRLRRTGVLGALVQPPIHRFDAGPAAAILQTRIAATRYDERAICWFGFDLDSEADNMLYVSNQHRGGLGRTMTLLDECLQGDPSYHAIVDDICNSVAELAAVGVGPKQRLKLYFRIRQIPSAMVRSLGTLAPFAGTALRALPKGETVAERGVYVAYAIDWRTRALLDAKLEIAVGGDESWPKRVFAAAHASSPPAPTKRSAPSFLCLGGTTAHASVSLYSAPR